METLFQNNSGAILKIAKIHDHEYTYRKWSSINTTKRINPFYDNGTEDFSSYAGLLSTELRELDYITEFGREVAWCGEKNAMYTYTGKSHLCKGWYRYIWLMTTVVREFIHTAHPDKFFNHCLINHYSGTQHLNRHRDNEPELVGPIASLSYGASALFTYGNDSDGYNSILLEHGDLLIGNRKFFNTMYHEVGKPTDGKNRYALTWRTVDTLFKY